MPCSARPRAPDRCRILWGQNLSTGSGPDAGCMVGARKAAGGPRAVGRGESGLRMRIRELRRHELVDIWSIDRAEVVDAVYYCVGKELVRKPEHHDVKGWPPGQPEHDGP